MQVVKPFFDYNISEKCVTQENFENIVQRLLQFGYHTIAINQEIDESNVDQTKKKKKGETRDVVDIVPPPLEIKQTGNCESLKVLNRLTIIFSNQEIINKILKSPNYKKYHIVAVQPMSQQAFQFTCSNIEADIVTYDPESKPAYKITRKMYNQLIAKGFYFELLYAPVIEDSTKRKNMIANSHLYHSYGKSKNIIISSGATREFLLRNPYDIINMAILFGLNEAQAKSAIQHFGRDVYIHSVGRRHGKAIMFVENLHLNDEDKDDEEMVRSEKEEEEMELDQPALKKSKQ